MHPLQYRILAEELIRARRSDDPRRAIASQRGARIDPNPHQIEAVVFALSRIREGGCILADEVGLGKTIEAGLIITQLKSEGCQRVLLIAPKSLVGQWRQELETLFALNVREGSTRPGAFDGTGVFLINREAAGSEKGRDLLLSCEPFDLCVIDEAHELFAGIYKRFGSNGEYNEEAKEAQIAGRVRQVLHSQRVSVLLLTATPIQNNLAELWGLVQFVDPHGTLLGDLPTFRAVFCENDDRQLVAGQEEELKSRLRHVLKRTLRRQAQPFLERPFVSRQARLFEYTMSPAERSLYDDVTRYLLDPNVRAFQGRHRKLLLLGFHRRMASSTRALAASLEHVVRRLERLSLGEVVDPGELISDLEETDVTETDSVVGELDRNVEQELERVRSFVQRARALGGDGRFQALLKAIEFVRSRAQAGQGADKLVIFTESLVTQDYLRASLLQSGLVADEDITVFRGENEGPRAHQALERWRSEERAPNALSRDVAQRLALVHEFKTRSRIFLSSEAGAKGLNLQFCNALVNWDLPWNPQRIEQRIGRCHRYGQTHDVTVINFIAKENDAQALTFEILSQKFELFGTVLSASDEVLHRFDGEVGGEVLVSALGADFEAALADIYERSRTLDEVRAELRALREKVTTERQRFEETRARTAGLIESRLDEDVRRVFRQRRSTLEPALKAIDDDLARIVRAVQGQAGAAGHTLHLDHPAVRQAIAQARAPMEGQAVSIKSKVGFPQPGSVGRLRLVKVSFDGFEQTEAVVPVLVGSDGRLRAIALPELLDLTLTTVPVPALRVSEEVMEDAQERAIFEYGPQLEEAEHQLFHKAAMIAERFVEDRLLILEREKRAALGRLEVAERRREGALGAESRTDAEAALAEAATRLEALENNIELLRNRDDERYQRAVAHARRRRYSVPRREVLVDVDVVFT